jgi:hypothetical protein
MPIKIVIQKEMIVRAIEVKEEVKVRNVMIVKITIIEIMIIREEITLKGKKIEITKKVLIMKIEVISLLMILH